MDVSQDPSSDAPDPILHPTVEVVRSRMRVTAPESTVLGFVAGRKDTTMMLDLTAELALHGAVRPAVPRPLPASIQGDGVRPVARHARSSLAAPVGQASRAVVGNRRSGASGGDGGWPAAGRCVGLVVHAPHCSVF